jgi:hypothetical protein
MPRTSAPTFRREPAGHTFGVRARNLSKMKADLRSTTENCNELNGRAETSYEPVPSTTGSCRIRLSGWDARAVIHGDTAARHRFHLPKFFERQLTLMLP